MILSEAWNFCPGRLNPADFPPRRAKARDLKNSEIWWHGPKFLRETQEAWPEQPNIQAPYDQVQDDMKAEFRKSIQKLSTNYVTAALTFLLKQLLILRFIVMSHNCFVSQQY